MQLSTLTEKLMVVSFRICQFSGYRHATRELIAKLGGNLPACRAITEGSIKVFPNDGLKQLNTLRRRTQRFFQGLGIQVLGSSVTFAVPASDMAAVEKKVAELEQDFNQAKLDLERDYDDLFEQHVKANHEAEEIIRGLKVEKTAAINKCRFEFNLFRVHAVARAGQTEEESLEGMIRGFSRRLYEEVAEEFSKLSESDFVTRLRVGQRSLAVIKAQLAKMKRLDFLDDTVPYAVKAGDELLAMMPKTGFIEGNPFEVLAKYIEMMSDPDGVLNMASLVRKGVSLLDVLFPPKVEEKPVVKTQPAVAMPKVSAVLPKVQPARPVAPLQFPASRNKVPGLPGVPSVPRSVQLGNAKRPAIPNMPRVPNLKAA